ncbi:hypothetical protein ACVIJ6_007510 [Bradyrhizobium sp. USDA 4369]
MSSLPADLHDEEDGAPWAGLGLAATVVLAAHILALVGYLALHRPAPDLAAAPVVTVELLPPSTEPSSQTVDVAPAQDAVVTEPVAEPTPQLAPPPEDASSEPEQQSAATVPPQRAVPVEQMSQPAASSEISEPLIAAPPPAQTAVELPKPEANIHPPAARHPKIEHTDRKKPAARSAETTSARTAKLVAPPRHQDVASVGTDDGRAAWLGELRGPIAARKTLSGRGGRRAPDRDCPAQLHGQSQRPRSVAPHRTQFRLIRARPGGSGHDRTRPAAAALSAKHAPSPDGPDRPDHLLAVRHWIRSRRARRDAIVPAASSVASERPVSATMPRERQGTSCQPTRLRRWSKADRFAYPAPGFDLPDPRGADDEMCGRCPRLTHTSKKSRRRATSLSEAWRRSGHRVTPTSAFPECLTSSLSC